MFSRVFRTVNGLKYTLKLVAQEVARTKKYALNLPENIREQLGRNLQKIAY